jgi:hypothetical protein
VEPRKEEEEEEEEEEVTNQNYTHAETKTRLHSGNACYHSFESPLSYRRLYKIKAHM